MKQLLTALLLCFLMVEGAHAQAPSSIAGNAISVTVTNGTGAFASYGYYLFLPADSGASYQIIGADGVANSSGTYSYSSSNASGFINLNDTSLGTATGALAFSTATSGTFSLTAGANHQSGTFVLAATPVTTSMAGKSVSLTIQAGASPFANSGSVLFTTAASGNTYTSAATQGGTANSSGTYSFAPANASTGVLSVNDSVGGDRTTYFAFTTANSGSYLATQSSTGGFQIGNFTVGRTIADPFFDGQVDLSSNVEYLQFTNGVVFGYYNTASFSFPTFYHYDLGFEYFIAANNAANGCYLYDYSSGSFFYTEPGTFPYLYDFKLNAWLYYFPDPYNPGRYCSNPRYFFNFGTGKIITK